jgi:hypothetical protein
LSEDEPPANNHGALPLHDLVRAGMKERGWSYSDLERASGRALTRGRWQQLGSGVVQRKFPDPSSLSVISEVLEVDITTVVLAAARSVGLDVRTRGTDLAHLLPALTERLSERMRDAILTLVRAAVAETRHGEGSDDAPSDALQGLRLEWPKSTSPSGSDPAHSDHSRQGT